MKNRTTVQHQKNVIFLVGFLGVLLANMNMSEGKISSNKDIVAILEKAAKKFHPKAIITDLSSTNMHLKGKGVIHVPFTKHILKCLKAHPDPITGVPHLQFIACNEGSMCYQPVTNESLKKIFSEENIQKWTDQEFIHAAELSIHVQTPANEDGWITLNSAKEFMDIKFNMTPEKENERNKFARKIVPPKVIRNKGNIHVVLFSWHLIGGYLRRWDIKWDPNFKISSESLGRFGGGGYD